MCRFKKEAVAKLKAIICPRELQAWFTDVGNRSSRKFLQEHREKTPHLGERGGLENYLIWEVYLKVRVQCEWTVNERSVSRLLLKENTRVHWVSPSWLCSCCSSCDCPSGTCRQNDKNSDIWSSPHSFLTQVDEGVPTCQQVQRGREAVLERASLGCLGSARLLLPGVPGSSV